MMNLRSLVEKTSDANDLSHAAWHKQTIAALVLAGECGAEMRPISSQSNPSPTPPLKDHLVDKHVAKTDAELAVCLAREPRLETAPRLSMSC